MSSNKIKNMAASVKSRLLIVARKSGRPFNVLLIQYGLERFLFRLSKSEFKDKFILKGGLFLVGIGIPQSRSTKDIDFLSLMHRDSELVSKAIRKVGNLKIDDGILYDFSNLTIEDMSGDSEYPGIRFKFSATLGQAKISMQVDVGFGDAIVPAASEMVYPTLLNMDPPVIRAYSLETVIAEKFEASLDLAELNSRMKDFYDIWLLSQKNVFSGITLQEAIKTTCQRRKTPLNSKAEIFSERFRNSPDKDTQWKSFVRKAQIANIPDKFLVIMEGIRAFLYPVVLATEKGDRFEKKWLPGGPWGNKLSKMIER